MLDVDLSKLIKNDMSRYALVTAAAKRARQISDEAFSKNEIIIEKPVSLAVEELKNGECTIIESQENL